jgi:hypothetical protein
MSTRQQACKQHFNTHSSHQQDEKFVVKLPTKKYSKQLGPSRLYTTKITCNGTQAGPTTQGSVPSLREEI